MTALGLASSFRQVFNQDVLKCEPSTGHLKSAERYPTQSSKIAVSWADYASLQRITQFAPVPILEDPRDRLRLEFREERTAQLAPAIGFAAVALPSLWLPLIGKGAEGLFLLVLSTVVTVYALTNP